ncbi:peptidoglycan DD-metalloendopeptidase family protein [Vallitalea sp.]|uniref:peptidoglycan DD-metalloendopeptidase family protein n=1 Tax=Vallitalea sp. TaxID=1882829 RepID=UPI0025CC0D3D|nr:peptidoglycan DD-metalloendopeptidase family protein [Vallitalea sp.]
MSPINMKTVGKNTIVLIVMFFSLIFATVFIQANMNVQSEIIYKVTYKNSEIGFVQDTENIGQIMKDVTTRLQNELETVILVDDLVSTFPVKKEKQVLMTDEELANGLFNTLIYNKNDFFVKANVLSIDKQTKIVVKDEQTAESVLEDVKSDYLLQGNQGSVEAVAFVESVQEDTLYVSQESIIQRDEAVSKLKSSKEEKVTYTIKSGDTLSEVANDNGMGLSELLKINPQFKRDSVIQIGQEVNLMVPKPLLSVKVKEKLTYEESIACPIEYQKDSSKYKTYKKTIQQGEPGIRELTTNVTCINGLESEREIVSEKVIKEPTKTIIVVGTRSLPTFSRPVYGRITSPFGRRWGSFHTGIDIGVPRGTKVKAAESGTVIFAGWSGGYGYLVKIDHGEGYTTYYAHNSKLYVKKGQKVTKGQSIAASGSTGNSTGPHVHFEVRKNGTPQNPSNYL